MRQEEFKLLRSGNPEDKAGRKEEREVVSYYQMYIIIPTYEQI